MADLVNAVAIGALAGGSGLVFPVVLIPIYAVPRAFLRPLLFAHRAFRADEKSSRIVAPGREAHGGARNRCSALTQAAAPAPDTTASSAGRRARAGDPARGQLPIAELKGTATQYLIAEYLALDLMPCRRDVFAARQGDRRELDHAGRAAACSRRRAIRRRPSLH